MVLLLSYRPLKAGMYVAGFTGAGIQILLIMVIQSLYGFAYMVAPIMITIFMAGLVTGVQDMEHGLAYSSHRQNIRDCCGSWQSLPLQVSSC